MRISFTVELMWTVDSTGVSCLWAGSLHVGTIAELAASVSKHAIAGTDDRFYVAQSGPAFMQDGRVWGHFSLMQFDTELEARHALEALAQKVLASKEEDAA